MARPRLRLGHLFLLWLLAVLVLVLGLTVAVAVWQEEAFLRGELEARAHDLAQVLAVAAREGWIDRAPTLGVPELRGVVVTDATGRPLWRHGPELSEAEIRSTRAMIVRETVAADGAQPVEVVMRLSTARIRAHVVASAARLVGGLTAVLAVALGLGAALVHRVTEPIDELAGGMRAFQPGTEAPPSRTRPISREVDELLETFHEMAERLTAQRRELVESEERFRELFMTSPTPVLEITPHLTVLHANTASEPFLGKPADQARGLALGSFLDPPLEAPLDHGGEGGSAERVLERRWRLPGGDLAEVDLHLRPLVGTGGRWLVTVHDLTDRVRRLGERWRRTFDAMPDGVAVLGADGAVQIANRALSDLLPGAAAEGVEVPEGGTTQVWDEEHGGRYLRLSLAAAGEPEGGRILVVHDATAELRAQERLRQTRELEVIATLASGVAHDFNNLLAGILLHLRVLEHSSGVDPEAVKAIRELAEEGAEVVRELLVYARRESSPRRAVDLVELVRGHESVLHHLTSGQVKLSLRLADEAVMVLASPGELRRVLLNLVLNAREATAAHGGEVLVEVGVDGEDAVLAVADDGAGMPPEELERAFEPFVSLRRGGTGTGLGLAAVRAVAQEHGGSVHAESVVGVGSRFTVRLPLRRDLEKPAEVELGEPLPVAGNERVLVVEDELSVAERLLAELAAVGYDVRHAADLEQAFDVVSAWPPDLLVVDLFLRDGLGLELPRRLAGQGAPIPTLVVTGNRAEAIQQLPGDLPEVAVLEKPFAVEHLLHELRRLLRDGGHI